MQRTNLNNLAAFISVAGERSFTRAAAKLGISQSSLSHLIRDLGRKPGGTIRISSTDHATDAILWPRLTPFLRQYPGVKLELITDYGLTDIVAERFDAGVRAGEQIAKDMIAVRIGPDISMAVVGAPAAHSRRPVCVGVRKGQARDTRPWRRTDYLQRHTADAECGACGLRTRLFARRSCAARRQPSAAFALMVEALRYRH